MENNKHVCSDECTHDHKVSEVQPLDLELTPSMNEKELNLKIKEKLNVTLLLLKKNLCSFIKKNLNTLSKNVISIAPFNDYSRFVNEPEDVLKFIKEEVCKSKNWKIVAVTPIVNNDKQLVKFQFNCIAADDGNIFKGYIYVDNEGSILHSSVDFDGKFFKS